MEVILCCCHMEKSYFPDINLLDALGYNVIGFCDGAPERIGIAHDVIGITSLPPDETLLADSRSRARIPIVKQSGIVCSSVGR